MERIRKNVARKMWNNGKSLMIIPCNLRPGTMWTPISLTSKKELQERYDDGDFDKMVNAFEYYNCTNNEVGKYAAYYIKED